MKVEMNGEDDVPKTRRNSVIKSRSDNVDISNYISDALLDINHCDVSNRSGPASEEQSEFDAENEKPFSSSKNPSSPSSRLLNDAHFQRKNSWNSDRLSTTSSSISATSESSYSWNTSSGISSYESRNENHKSETPSPRKPPTTNKSSSMKMKSVSMISSRYNQNSRESGSTCKENNTSSSSGFFSSSSLSSSSNASFLRSSSSASFSRSSSHASSLFRQLDQNQIGRLSIKVVKLFQNQIYNDWMKKTLIFIVGYSKCQRSAILQIWYL